MSLKLKYFFIVVFLGLFSGFCINVLQKELENFLFWKEMADNPHLLTIQITQEEKLEKLKPIRKSHVENLEMEAEAVISVFVDHQNNSERVLFEKNSNRIFPIASLTKLMTAVIVLENYDIFQIEDKELLYRLLIASDNDAAIALAEIIGEKTFVDLMNLKAKKLGLNNTYFANPSGLDPKVITDPINYSTAKDLVKFAKYLTTEKPLIWEISIIPKFGNITNTNELLDKISGIIGSKTGETPRAGKCLLVVVNAPKNKGYIINIILNSKNRFEEMKKLIEWTQYAYHW